MIATGSDLLRHTLDAFCLEHWCRGLTSEIEDNRLQAKA